MLAYTLKEILDLVPEAASFVKKASVEQDMPLDSKDSCIASALKLKYHEKVAFKAVDVFAIEKVAQAVKAYGVEAEVASLSERMVNAAFEKSAAAAAIANDDYLTKQAYFEGELSGLRPEGTLSKEASALYDEAVAKGIKPSDDVVRYSGHGFMDKEAAVKALANRFYETRNPSFVKLATAIHKLQGQIKPETVRDICDTICGMDKEAGLSTKGYNFYKETILTKEAEVISALKVKLCGQDVPFEKIAKLGKGRFSAYMGADVGNEFDHGPAHFKQILETLPMDLQKVALHLTKNV
jgi:hypothetical protein